MTPLASNIFDFILYNIRLDGEIKDFQISQFHNELNTKIAKQGASHHWPEER